MLWLIFSIFAGLIVYLYRKEGINREKIEREQEKIEAEKVKKQEIQRLRKKYKNFSTNELWKQWKQREQLEIDEINILRETLRYREGYPSEG